MPAAAAGNVVESVARAGFWRWRENLAIRYLKLPDAEETNTYIAANVNEHGFENNP